MCLKINRILMIIILTIVSAAIFLLILLAFSSKKKVNPEKLLEDLGYSYNLIEEKQIVIPKNFNENLQNYNKLQKSQGFDLQKYSGKICAQKTYSIQPKEQKQNKNEKNKSIANLIVFENEVIGGDLHDQAYGSKAKALNK